jgi:hypothetical protein
MRGKTRRRRTLKVLDDSRVWRRLHTTPAFFVGHLSDSGQSRTETLSEMLAPRFLVCWVCG